MPHQTVNTVDNHSHLRLNARMIVCVCNAMSEADIRQKAADGLRNFDALRAETGCSDCCGCCESTARQVFAEAQTEQRRQFVLPLAIAAVA